MTRFSWVPRNMKKETESDINKRLKKPLLFWKAIANNPLKDLFFFFSHEEASSEKLQVREIIFNYTDQVQNLCHSHENITQLTPSCISRNIFLNFLPRLSKRGCISSLCLLWSLHWRLSDSKWDPWTPQTTLTKQAEGLPTQRVSRVKWARALRFCRRMLLGPHLGTRVQLQDRHHVHAQGSICLCQSCSCDLRAEALTAESSEWIFGLRILWLHILQWG